MHICCSFDSAVPARCQQSAHSSLGTRAPGGRLLDEQESRPEPGSACMFLRDWRVAAGRSSPRSFSVVAVQNEHVNASRRYEVQVLDAGEHD